MIIDAAISVMDSFGRWIEDNVLCLLGWTLLIIVLCNL